MTLSSLYYNCINKDKGYALCEWIIFCDCKNIEDYNTIFIYCV